MLTLRSFTAADIPHGMAFKTQAGWNQLPGDWERLLALQPDGGLLAEWDGQAAGTVFACVFDDVAWIAMMLVEESLRGRGIGRQLMTRALAFAEERGARSIRLDATPQGQPLYERLGFRGDFPLVRYAGVCATKPGYSESRASRSGDFLVKKCPGHEEVSRTQAIIACDRAATGTNRTKLMQRLLDEQPVWCITTGDVVSGYATRRPGSRAVQIGPCIADAETGPVLLAHALQQHAGQPVLLDIPADHREAIQIAEQHGLRPVRDLLRMTRGERVAEQVERLWASSGPEKG
jgi:GNAT superfamily N-acetyltransferase